MIQLWRGKCSRLLFELCEMAVRFVPGPGRYVRFKLIKQNLRLQQVLPQLYLGNWPLRDVWRECGGQRFRSRGWFGYRIRSLWFFKVFLAGDDVGDNEEPRHRQRGQRYEYRCWF